MSLSVSSFKLLTSLIIFLIGLVSTICPLFIAGRNECIFSAGNMFASGVLLAAGLTHQLADSASSLDQEDGYPWSFLICGLTFIMFLIFEESVHMLLGIHGHDEDIYVQLGGGGGKKQQQQQERGRIEETLASKSCRGSMAVRSIVEPEDEEEEEDCEEKKENGDLGYGSTSHHSPFNNNHKEHSHHHHHHHHHGHASHASSSLLDTERSVDRQSSRDRQTRRMSFQNSQHAKHSSHGDTKQSLLSSFVYGDPNRQSVVGAHHHHDDHIEDHLHGSFLASVMLLAALSVHSLLEGLSIGLVSNTSDIFSTAVAILGHKFFAGYALGSTMVAADIGWGRHVPLGAAFSICTPIGVFMGMGLATVTSAYDEDSPAVGIVNAIVAGTFLYVAIIEVGMKELLIVRGDHGSQMSLSEKQMEAFKLVSMLVGYIAMSALALYV